MSETQKTFSTGTAVSDVYARIIMHLEAATFKKEITEVHGNAIDYDLRLLTGFGGPLSHDKIYIHWFKTKEAIWDSPLPVGDKNTLADYVDMIASVKLSWFVSSMHGRVSVALSISSDAELKSIDNQSEIGTLKKALDKQSSWLSNVAWQVGHESDLARQREVTLTPTENALNMTTLLAGGFLGWGAIAGYQIPSLDITSSPGAFACYVLFGLLWSRLLYACKGWLGLLLFAYTGLVCFGYWYNSSLAATNGLY